MKRYSVRIAVVRAAEGVEDPRKVSAIVREVATVPPTAGKKPSPAEGVGKYSRLGLPCKKRVYISGPMTGRPQYNRPAFFAMEKRLKALGFSVLNPAGWPEQPTYEDYLRVDLAMLSRYADAIMLLDGWEHSRGARAEAAMARGLGLPVLFEAQLDEVEYDEP